MDNFRYLLWRPASLLRTSRRWLFWLIAVTTSTLILLTLWLDDQRVARTLFGIVQFVATSGPNNTLPLCRQLLGADDVVVVMKTGASEVEDKLTVHLRTTLTCYPNVVIISDYEEDLATGQHLFDAFEYASRSIKEQHQDFAFWRKLQAEGRDGLELSELSGTDSREKPEDTRKQIPGWQLDKWKFLPMVNQTLYLYPDKHWYVFVEPDTYILWSNLLPYMAERSWTDNHYIGSRAVIEELGFAHGGSGFVLSRPALEKVVLLFNAHREEWEAFTDRYWVGDHILAAALREVGVLLEDGSPTWQGNPIGLMDARPEGRVWCSTAMTFHHQLPTEIEDLWNFEQALISEGAASGQTQLLHHRDVFEQYVLPRIERPRLSWDNKADSSINTAVSSLHLCEALCEEDVKCMQFALYDNKTCKTTSKVMFGELAEGVESGWMLERIRNSLDGSKEC